MNMDLKLSGSQINLATRDKRPTPAVQYPFNHRPGSANNVATTINRSSLALRGRPKRPQSADTFILKSNLKGGYSFLGENCGEKSKLKRPLSSSSNLLNILLSEQIKRSWSTPEPDLNSDCSLGGKIRTRSSSQMDLHSDGGEGSSIEEDISINNTYRSNSLPKKVKKSKPRSASNTLKRDSKLAQSDSGKKFVTFGNTHFVENTSLSGHSANSGSDNQEKPDLPGRVSFSKSDVYEIDFSDYENGDELLANYSSSASKVSFNKLIRTPSIAKSHDDCDPAMDNYCCALKCNSMASTVDECDLASADKGIATKSESADHSDSSAVIEDYKKEVESLNRSREMDIAEKEESDDTASITKQEVPRLQLTKYSDTAITATERTNAANKYNEKTAYNNSKSVSLLNLKPLNNNNGGNEQHTKSASNEVINNYLKATNQNDNYTPSSAKQNNLSKAPKQTKVIKKVKQSVPDKVKQKSKLADHHDEFHMEKVESWMSIHEKRFSDSKCDIGENAAYNNEWRETPNSKTDDEGNFSFEDPIDDGSNGESNYDEIVSVIKEIDEEKIKDLEAIEHAGTSPSSTLKLKTSARSDTPDKMAEILSYLDNVDSTCIKTMQETFSYKIPDSFRSDIEFAVEPDIVGDMPKISDLVILPNHQLARRIVALTLRANELSNAIQLSKEHMVHVRADKQKAIRIEKQNSQARIAEQKNHFESIVSRHQGFIEQLLKDKAVLCEKVSALTRRIESQNQAWEHKLQTEIVRVKESALAGEKIRRERWVRENTKKIKELTVKGLEDEINKMTCNHQKEITELKRQHQQDILDAVEKTRQKHEIMEMGIRDTYAQDREAAIEKERSAIRERFERQMAFEQRTFHEEKTKMMAEFVHEKDRIYTEFKEKEQDFERRRDEYVFDKNQEIHFLKKELREKISLNEKKHQSDLASVREQFESDFLIWRREHEAAFKIREVEKENTVRNQCRIERDKQIDDIIAKVDSEALKNQNEFESKILRLKEKYENDLQNLEQTERLTREKYNETRTRLAECEANKQNMQSTVKQLELQLSHAQKMCDEFLHEKENMKENARKEIELEVSNLKKERDNEIERIYARVQQAIEKKDATSDMVQKENGALKERCIKLEAIIRQQRKDYCTK